GGGVPPPRESNIARAQRRQPAVTADKNRPATPPNPDDKSMPEPRNTIAASAAAANPADTGFTLQTPRPEAAPRSGPNRAAATWVGGMIGKYLVTGVLGQGGMGVVLKGRDPVIERDVAIKILPEELAADQQALARFLSEARAAGKLSHPNVTAVYEI